MAASAAAKKPQKRATKTATARAVSKSPSKSAAKPVARAAKATKPRKASSAKPRGRTARTTEGNVVTPEAWGMAQRTQELVNVLGGVSALARALGVSPSQPSRWKSGKEQPGPDMARRLLDLDHVVARAQMVWHPSVVPTWLVSANGHLNGQTPLGVLMTRGPNEVLDALDATEQGAFA